MTDEEQRRIFSKNLNRYISNSADRKESGMYCDKGY